MKKKYISPVLDVYELTLQPLLNASLGNLIDTDASGEAMSPDFGAESFGIDNDALDIDLGEGL